MEEKVINIRANFSIVPDETGIYIWWFDESALDELIFSDSNSSVIDKKIIKSKRFGFKKYYALYLGQAKKESIRQRAQWHIAQTHSASAVTHGTLSTLRQTISALLGTEFSQSERTVNDFLDAHCIFEWVCITDIEEIDAVEKQNIQGGYFPLNIEYNTALPKEWLSHLTEIRRQYKK